MYLGSLSLSLSGPGINGILRQSWLFILKCYYLNKEVEQNAFKNENHFPKQLKQSQENDSLNSFEKLRD